MKFVQACQKALDLRWSKFHRNAALLKRQLTWQYVQFLSERALLYKTPFFLSKRTKLIHDSRFNSHLRKKGISGHVKIDYEAKTLAVEVKMPQDASGDVIRDTRGLSGLTFEYP